MSLTKEQIDLLADKLKGMLCHVNLIPLNEVEETGLFGSNRKRAAEIAAYLGYLGTEIDKEQNNVRGEERIISKAGSKVTMLCVPTNEELSIARQTLALVK